MKVLWTLLKAATALLVLIPVGMIVLGVVGAVFGVAFLALRLALIGLLSFGALKLVIRVLRGPGHRVEANETPRLSTVDPYYQSAMRELERDLA